MVEKETDHTSTVLYTIVHSKQNFPIFDTTDNKALNDVLHYSTGDREFFIGREFSMIIDEKGHTKKYKVVDIVVCYFDTKIINESRYIQGTVIPYNNQVMVYVDEIE